MASPFLAVASSSPWYAVPDQQRATNTITSEKGARSFIELPIVGGKDAAKAAFPAESNPLTVEDEVAAYTTTVPTWLP